MSTLVSSFVPSLECKIAIFLLLKLECQNCWQWAGPCTCAGRIKTLPPSASLPVMGEIAGVNTASLGGYLHSSKKRAGWAEGFHDELSGHVFNLQRMGSVRLYFACDSPCDENKQPYHTGSVAARVNKDRAFSVHQDQRTDRSGGRQVPEGSGEQAKMEETGFEIICGATTTVAVKG